MLKVWFGHDCPFPYMKTATSYVSAMLRTEDINLPLVREMVKDIDDVDMDEDGRMWHPVFGAINQSMLSNGVCGLIMAYVTDYPTDITRMGDNCMPWLLKIADEKDITCVCNRSVHFPRDFVFQDLQSGNILRTREKFAAYHLYKVVREVTGRDPGNPDPIKYDDE